MSSDIEFFFEVSLHENDGLVLNFANLAVVEHGAFSWATLACFWGVIRLASALKPLTRCLIESQLVSWRNLSILVRWNLTHLFLVCSVDRWEKLFLCRSLIVKSNSFWIFSYLDQWGDFVGYSSYLHRINEENISRCCCTYILSSKGIWPRCESSQKISEIELNIVSSSELINYFVN